MLNIVILDGYALNPGDLSWEGLGGLGNYRVYDRTTPEQTLARARDAEIVLTNKTVLDRQTIAQLPQLRYIGVLATGYNVVDCEAAAERGVVVTNVPAYSTASVAQMVFALLLEMTQQVGHHAARVREGGWSESPDFCFWERHLVELEGLTLGVVGFGAIGRKVAQIAAAFGMEVLVSTAHPERHADRPESAAVRFAELDELFAESDVVSLHCPLTPETEKLVDARRLARMKPTAYLINTGRGALVVEAALAAALDGGHLAGAGLDVLCSEPPAADNPLAAAENAFITPHVAWATTAARRRLMATAVLNVRAFLDGEPMNVVG